MAASSSIHPPNHLNQTLTQGVNCRVLRTSCRNGTSTNRAIKENRKRSSVSKFHDDYEAVGEILGHGAFASVETYKHKESGKEFAVKIISKCDTRKRSKVYKEIKILQGSSGNENILNLVEYFEEDGAFYLVYEKMEGGNLLTYITKRGYLTEREVSIVVRQIAAALGFLHSKGIAHRDLKLTNILCSKSGEPLSVKLCDFDLANDVEPGANGSDGTNTLRLRGAVGTPGYMAPEVVAVWVGESLEYDEQCDLWSLGVVLYKIFCGHQPFSGQCGKNGCGRKRRVQCEECDRLLNDSIRYGTFGFDGGKWNRVSDSAKDLIRHLLVRDPGQRYSVSDVLRHPWVMVPSSPTPPQIPTRRKKTQPL